MIRRLIALVTALLLLLLVMALGARVPVASAGSQPHWCSNIRAGSPVVAFSQGWYCESDVTPQYGQGMEGHNPIYGAAASWNNAYMSVGSYDAAGGGFTESLLTVYSAGNNGTTEDPSQLQVGIIDAPGSGLYDFYWYDVNQQGQGFLHIIGADSPTGERHLFSLYYSPSYCGYACWLVTIDGAVYGISTAFDNPQAAGFSVGTDVYQGYNRYGIDPSDIIYETDDQAYISPDDVNWTTPNDWGGSNSCDGLVCPNSQQWREIDIQSGVQGYGQYGYAPNPAAGYWSSSTH